MSFRDPTMIMADLLATGLNPKQVILAMELASASAAAALQGPEETPAERKKRISRETSQRHRASQNVTTASPKSGKGGDAECHQTSPRDTETSPLARVEDNLLIIEVTGTLSLSQVRECAGDALASMATHPGIATLAPLLALLKGAAPCLPDEIYDGVTRAAAWYRARGSPGQMKSWDLARKIALETRDHRLAGPPAPQEPTRHERPHSPAAKRTSREDNLARSLAGFEAASDERRLVASGG